MQFLAKSSLTLALLLTLSVVASAQESSRDPLPLSQSNSPSDYSIQAKPLTFPQQQARIISEQALARIELNKWYGYSPTRPNANASYLTSGLYNFYPAHSYSVRYPVGRRYWGW